MADNYTGTEWITRTKLSTDLMADMDEGIQKGIDAAEAAQDAADTIDSNQRIKCYYTLAQIGMSSPTTTIEIIQYMNDNGYINTDLFLNASTSTVTDIPGGDGLLYIHRGNGASNRYGAVEYFRNCGNGGQYYFGHILASFSGIKWIPFVMGDDLENQITALETENENLKAQIAELEDEVSELNTNLIATRTFTSEAIDIASGGYNGFTLDVGLSGYTPIGIVTSRVTGSTSVRYGCLSGYRISGNTATINYNNRGSGTYSWTCEIIVLYLKS